MNFGDIRICTIYHNTKVVWDIKIIPQALMTTLLGINYGHKSVQLKESIWENYTHMKFGTVIIMLWV